MQGASHSRESSLSDKTHILIRLRATIAALRWGRADISGQSDNTHSLIRARAAIAAFRWGREVWERVTGILYAMPGTGVSILPSYNTLRIAGFNITMIKMLITTLN
jgi:hypothetical protein